MGLDTVPSHAAAGPESPSGQFCCFHTYLYLIKQRRCAGHPPVGSRSAAVPISGIPKPKTEQSDRQDRGDQGLLIEPRGS